MGEADGDKQITVVGRMKIEVGRTWVPESRCIVWFRRGGCRFSQCIGCGHGWCRHGRHRCVRSRRGGCKCVGCGCGRCVRRRCIGSRHGWHRCVRSRRGGCKCVGCGCRRCVGCRCIAHPPSVPAVVPLPPLRLSCLGLAGPAMGPPASLVPIPPIMASASMASMLPSSAPPATSCAKKAEGSGSKRNKKGGRS